MDDGRIEELKSALRDKARTRRGALNGAERAEAAKAAARHFGASVPVGDGDIVALFWSIRDEIDSKPLLLMLMDAGLRVALPVVMGENAPLLFRVWEPDAPLVEAGFGTLAPGEMAPVAVPDVMVIPLLGFDRVGTRLGYGRGYYDRTIAALPKRPLLVGYAFAAQELGDIPRKDHDVPLDLIVTETGVRRFDN